MIVRDPGGVIDDLSEGSGVVVGGITQFAAVVGDKNGLPGLEGGVIGQANDEFAHASSGGSHARGSGVIELEVL